MSNMKYYYELLEAYTKIKKREFKLDLIQESLARSLYQPGQYDSALNSAEQALQQVLPTVPPDGSPVPIGNAGATIKMQSNGNFVVEAGFGGKKYSAIINKNNPSLSALKPSEQTKAVGSIMGPPEQGSPSSEEQADSQGLSSDPMAQGGMGDVVDPMQAMMMNPDEAGMAIMDKDGLSAQIFMQIENNFLKLWDVLPGSVRDELATSKAKAKNFLVGGRPQSIEKQLRHAIALTKMSEEEKEGEAPMPVDLLRQTGDDEFDTFSPKEISVDLTRSVAKRLAQALGFAHKDNLSQDEKLSLKRSFSILDGRQVVVHRDTMNEGVIFHDNTGFLKSILGHLEEKFDIMFDKKTTAALRSSSSAKSVRGKILEDTYCVASLFAQARITGNEAFREAGREYLRKSISDLRGFIQVNRDWSTQYLQGEMGSSYEDYPDLAVWLGEFQDLEIKGVEGILKSITKLHKDSMGVRAPDISIPVGKRSGIGISDDINEVYFSYDKARQALINSGFSENLLKQTTLGELVQENPLLGQSLAKHGMPLNTPVFSVKVSLKHPVSGRETVLGSAKLTRAVSFLTGGIDKLSRTDRKKSAHYKAFRDKVNSSLGIASNSVLDKRSNDILRTMVKGFGIFGEKPNKVLISKKGGQNVRQRFLSTRLNTLREQIERVTSYRDKFGKSSKSELYSALKNIESSLKDETDYSYRIDELAGRVKLEMDLLTGLDSQPVRAMVGKLFMSTAGSVDDQIFDYKNLSTKESFTFEQNSAISSIMKDFINHYPNGEWDFDVRSTEKATKLEFKHKTDPKRSLTYDIYGVSSDKADGGTKRTMNAQVQFSTNLIKHLHESKSSSPMMANALEHKVKQFIQLQKELQAYILA